METETVPERDTHHYPPAAAMVPAVDAGHFDVIVVGAGLSGICAATAAAEEGASVLLVESQPFIGGNGALGLSLSSYRAAQSTRLVVGGLPLKLARHLEDTGAIEVPIETVDWIEANPEALHEAALSLLETSGVTLVTYSPLLSTHVVDSSICGVFAYNKDGTCLYYSGTQFIDASGDAQLAHLAGARTSMGRARDGLTQSMSLVFTVAGVDDSRAPSNDELAQMWDDLADAGAYRRNLRRTPASNSIVGKPGWRSFIATRVVVPKGTDNRLLTQAEIEGRAQVKEFVEDFLIPQVPGYENAYVAAIAPRIGVRETRRVAGLYEMTERDILSCARFEDSIACNSMSIENHTPDSGDVEWSHLGPGDYYQIPLRSIIAADVPNLFASGRCMSASHEALAALRVLVVAMATGEAAGTAAAVAIQTGCADVRRLDASMVRERLRLRGAIVD